MEGTRLVLVRHGESNANVAGILAGHRSCTGLSARGRHQAERLGERLARSPTLRPDAVLASTLPRARETAALATAGWWSGRVVEDEALCELHPGECDGMTWDDYQRTYGGGDDPDAPLSPGGESLAGFDARCRTALGRVLDEHAGDTVHLVSHGGFIAAACLFLLGMPGIHVPRSFRLDAANTSLTEWRCGADGSWSLVRFNDTAHLDERSEPDR